MTDQCLGDGGVDVGHGFRHAFAEIAALVAVAQLPGFVFAGAGAARYGSATKRATR